MLCKVYIIKSRAKHIYIIINDETPYFFFFDLTVLWLSPYHHKTFDIYIRSFLFAIFDIYIHTAVQEIYFIGVFCCCCCSLGRIDERFLKYRILYSLFILLLSPRSTLLHLNHFFFLVIGFHQFPRPEINEIISIIANFSCTL